MEHFQIHFYVEYKGNYSYHPMGSYETKEEALKDASFWMRFFRPIKEAGNESIVLRLSDANDSDEDFERDPLYTLQYQEGAGSFSEDFVILKRAPVAEKERQL